jgi:hypothetical protein
LYTKTFLISPLQRTESRTSLRSRRELFREKDNTRNETVGISQRKIEELLHAKHQTKVAVIIPNDDEAGPMMTKRAQ